MRYFYLFLQSNYNMVAIVIIFRTIVAIFYVHFNVKNNS